MEIKKFIDNPIYWLCMRYANTRHAPLDMILIRFSYQLFFPNMFREDELLKLFRDLFTLYIKALDVVYGGYDGLEDRFVLPSKRFNLVYIHLSGILSFISNSQKFTTKKIVSLHDYPEFSYVNTDFISLWRKQRSKYIKQLSLVDRDLTLSSRYGVKQQKYLQIVTKAMNKGINSHLILRKKHGVILNMDNSLPKRYHWVNDKVYSLSTNNQVSFSKASGSPCRVFKRLVEANGDWVNRDELLCLINKSKDSLRSVNSEIRKAITRNKDSAEITVISDHNGHYRLAKV